MRQTQTITKLEGRASDLERQLALKSASEKTATTSLKTADIKNKTLKDDMIRLKATVGQIRAQCANDVRKREIEVKRLQKYLEPKRGREGSVQVGVTVVNPGMSLNSSAGGQGSKHHAQATLVDDTTEYLTQLARDFSIENEALRSLAQTTTSVLRQLQGIPEPANTEHDYHNGSISQSVITSHEDLETDLIEVLDQLKTLLTNPSFVPLEEVEIREDEIARLRAGWEKMESRWREALSLMNSWRKRMMETGDVINLDDLRKGIVLGSTPISIPQPTSARKGRLSGGCQLPSPDDSLVEDGSLSISSDQQEEETIRKALDINAELESPVRSNSEEKLGMGLFPAPVSKILHPTVSNPQRIPRLQRKRRSIEYIENNNTEAAKESLPKRQRLSQVRILPESNHNTNPPFQDPLSSDPEPDPDLDTVLLDPSPESNTQYLRPSIEDFSEDEDIDAEEDENDILTVHQKLSHARREAQAAREAATALTQALAGSDPIHKPSPPKQISKGEKADTGPTIEVSIRDVQPPPLAVAAAAAATKPLKRTRVPTRIGGVGGTLGKRSKRRSTLLPEELAELIGS